MQNERVNLPARETTWAERWTVSVLWLQSSLSMSRYVAMPYLPCVWNFLYTMGTYWKMIAINLISVVCHVCYPIICWPNIFDKIRVKGLIDKIAIDAAPHRLLQWPVWFVQVCYVTLQHQVGQPVHQPNLQPRPNLKECGQTGLMIWTHMKRDRKATLNSERIWIPWVMVNTEHFPWMAYLLYIIHWNLKPEH